MRATVAATIAILVTVLASAVPASAQGLKLSTLQPACKCESLRAALTPEDVAEIEKLPAQVTATIAAVKGTPMAPADEAAQALARRITSGAFDGKFDRVKAGARACTMYWYGFVDLREYVVHRQCTVTREGDALGVSMTTGDGFAARLVWYLPGARVFAGRTFLASDTDQTYDKEVPANPRNAGFGNIVGLALADKGRLTLVTINQRGLPDTSPIYFLAIAIE